MPKKTKDEDSSSSDSGPDDVNPPPSKKSKGASSAPKGKSGGGGGGGSGDDEHKWLLEKKRFVTVREFRGQVYVDIREYYENDGELKPGKKGISLTASAWRKLLSLSDDIDEALKQMC
ncbi:RNA polymerase II transcriptional coactivator [Schistocerca americana]|uniref:RNA polymerase II transcriptional coactivator n=1 Tax=Schistocerca americana TaxID=7009 RepID=UPI001F4FA3D5|nr:RNA polymerase II transcriptional coactivator [Schistocerca americana]XP_047117683.1 RNA polymerase II transcriptional coactivator [Schistocerca piceifrons]XP_049787598.1 RNA polymerase II transcriptional coactivator [Schistocerca cancellata]XP_049815319.1 RNA polymerase II transcriptional coactivator [Schistocerca nitens]XP_049815321.1 RNA polymerase II transcriptional coactivator [Schistocerca nitens]XP_049831809.1 RNA polymerase II transcriptional coactivator-like [Schistocerca gregaria]